MTKQRVAMAQMAERRLLIRQTRVQLPALAPYEIAYSDEVYYQTWWLRKLGLDWDGILHRYKYIQSEMGKYEKVLPNYHKYPIF